MGWDFFTGLRSADSFSTWLSTYFGDLPKVSRLWNGLTCTGSNKKWGMPTPPNNGCRWRMISWAPTLMLPLLGDAWFDHFCLNKHGSRSTMCYLLDTFHAAACCCMLLRAAACCCMRLHAAAYFSWSFPLRKPLLWLDSARSRQYEQLRCRPKARFAQNPMHCSYITSKQRWVPLFMKNKKSKISAPQECVPRNAQNTRESTESTTIRISGSFSVSLFFPHPSPAHSLLFSSTHRRKDRPENKTQKFDDFAQNGSKQSPFSSVSKLQLLHEFLNFFFTDT